MASGKKAENHAYAASVFYFIYNFRRARGTLTKARGGIKTTPALAAGLPMLETVLVLLAGIEYIFG